MQLFPTNYKKITDEDLMLSISRGNKRAFDELYGRYANPLLHFFTRLLWKDREKAEDFVHDLFAKIIHKPELFDPTRAFKTWVYSVANNMCKNEYKKQEVRKNTSNGLDSSYAVADLNANVVNEVQDLLFKDAFQRCLEDLDPKHSEIFALRHEDGLSLKEIAEIVDISEGTVKSRLFYATKYLAESLKEFNPTENR
jgi:RNA polymerase sigma factor (sigma-70 family)